MARQQGRRWARGGSSAVACLLALCSFTCSRTRGADPLAGVDLLDGGTQPFPCERCDDGAFCNGAELCDPLSDRCLPAAAPACEDEQECTLDSCVESDRRCSHVATPRDRDGDGFDACDRDCDDERADIHPGAREVCDLIDQDCDGQSDEGLRSECGDCRPGCRLVHIPTRGELWDPSPDRSEAVTTDEGGERLVLTSDTSQRFDAWIANFVDGKVTKIDTRDGAQLARYDSVLDDRSNDAEPPDAECDPDVLGPGSGGNCPSRTAVDLNGAVYVANRAFERQGTVTKIAGFPDDCIDRDGDGEIRTSRDLDGNGQIDAFVAGEELGQDDECLLWTVNTGGRGGVPRALAIAADGHVWVGLHGESRVLELDPADGRTLRSIALPGFRPYGAVADAGGKLWLTGVGTGSIVSVDTRTGAVSSARTAPAPQSGCPSSYGIAVDIDGRVWIAGFTCPFAFGYDPASDRWTSVALPDSGVTRGIAADDRGNVLVASSHDFVELTPGSTFGFAEISAPLTRLSVFRASDGGELRVLGTLDAPLPGREAIGVGLDSQRRAWLVNQESGSATRVDLETLEIKHYAVGDKPYTYSDFTGFALRRITAPTGFVREIREGCSQGPSEWELAVVDADLNGGRIELRVRTAATEAALQNARFIGPFVENPAELLGPPGPIGNDRFIEVEARLISGDRRSSSSLREIELRLHCPL